MISDPQVTDHVLMIRPGCALANPETAASNAFQLAEGEAELSAVQAEFDQMVNVLTKAGVSVQVVQDTPVPQKPDAVFPNNWVSFHSGGIAVTYPMLSELRRRERRHDVLEGRKVLDLTGFEAEDIFLEGTGSMVLDRQAKIAYAALSPRTHPVPLEHFCAALGYFPLSFEALGPDGAPVYHTNVVMSVGEHFAMLCTEAIPHPNRVLAELQIARKEIIEITAYQMVKFGGNLLQLATQDGRRVIALSRTALDSYSGEQIRRLEAHGALMPITIPTIERLGGGSVRCMIAEVF